MYSLFFMAIVISTGEKEKKRGMLRRRIQLDCWLADWLNRWRPGEEKEEKKRRLIIHTFLSFSLSFFETTLIYEQAGQARALFVDLSHRAHAHTYIHVEAEIVCRHEFIRLYQLDLSKV
jgi:hypothetical protein